MFHRRRAHSDDSPKKKAPLESQGRPSNSPAENCSQLPYVLILTGGMACVAKSFNCQHGMTTRSPTVKSKSNNCCEKCGGTTLCSQADQIRCANCGHQWPKKQAKEMPSQFVVNDPTVNGYTRAHAIAKVRPLTLSQVAARLRRM